MALALLAEYSCNFRAAFLIRAAHGSFMPHIACNCKSLRRIFPKRAAGRFGKSGALWRKVVLFVALPIGVCPDRLSIKRVDSDEEKMMNAEHELDEWTEDSVLPASVMVMRDLDGESETWRIGGVVVGQRFASDEIRSMRMRSGPGGDIYMWQGYQLRLRLGSVSDYALNVNSPTPEVFIVARRDADGLRPLLVTVSLDEAQNLDATDLRGADETVHQVPMPPEVFRWLEKFVLDHYVPRTRNKKRGKRRSKAMFDAEVGDWAGDES
jgi:hypothetical protein